jgi:ABC-type phosphate transport system permease subunit
VSLLLLLLFGLSFWDDEELSAWGEFILLVGASCCFCGIDILVSILFGILFGIYVIKYRKATIFMNSLDFYFTGEYLSTS